MKRRTLLLGTAGVAVLGAAGGVLGAGELLTRPVLHPMGPPPASLGAEAVELRTAAGALVRGWFGAGRPGAGAVLLLHPLRGDRGVMMGRARWLRSLGYAWLAIDLPGHGESPADRLTFGANESRGAAAALAWLARRCPDGRIGAIGISLGAASLVLARPDPAPAAVVLESMYPTIREAVADRLGLHLGAPARALAPLLLAQLPWRLGLSPSDLRPISALPALRSPVMIAAGTADRHTPPAETERLFEAAHEPRELWLVPGAAHVDLHDFDPSGYEARVGEFLERFLRAPAFA